MIAGITSTTESVTSRFCFATGDLEVDGVPAAGRKAETVRGSENRRRLPW